MEATKTMTEARNYDELSREEQLRIYLEEKEKKKRKQDLNRRKSLRIKNRTLSESSANIRKSVGGRTSFSFVEKRPKRSLELVPTTGKKPPKEKEMPINRQLSYSTSSRKKKLLTSYNLPSSAQRIERPRNVVKEQTRNVVRERTRNGVKERTRNVMKKRDSKNNSRKRSLSERSPKTLPNPNKPLFTTRRRSETSNDKEDMIGLSIPILKNGITPLSPLSMLTLQSPKEASPIMEESNLLKTETLSPLVEKEQQQKDEKTSIDFDDNQNFTPSFDSISAKQKRKQKDVTMGVTNDNEENLSVLSEQYEKKTSRSQIECKRMINQETHASASSSCAGKQKMSVAEQSPGKKEDIEVEIAAKVVECPSSKIINNIAEQVKAEKSIIVSRKNNSVAATQSKTEESNDEDDTSENTHSLSLNDVVKLNGRTVLEPVSEKPIFSSENQIKQKLELVLVEREELLNQLSMMRISYDQRITPFRTVFEENRILRAQIGKLQQSHKTLQQEKGAVDSMVAHLQKEMMANLQVAVTNNNRLNRKLEKAHLEIQRLGGKVLDIEEVSNMSDT